MRSGLWLGDGWDMVVGLLTKPKPNPNPNPRCSSHYHMQCVVTTSLFSSLRDHHCNIHHDASSTYGAARGKDGSKKTGVQEGKIGIYDSATSASISDRSLRRRSWPASGKTAATTG